MGKKKPNTSNASTNNNQKLSFTNYGTHMSEVIKVGDVNINQICEDLFGNSPIVIAKDNNSMYVTSKRHVDSGLLDPYKTYKKNHFTIVENVVEGSDPTYTITNIKNNVSITI
jgi:hypothetical protein